MARENDTKNPMESQPTEEEMKCRLRTSGSES